MKIVGIQQPDRGVQVAQLSEDGSHVSVVCTLEEFWSDPAGKLATTPTGPHLPVADIEFVPPVLPGARVVCIGLNYLAHVAEGSYRADPLPAYPTLFARWRDIVKTCG